MTEKVLITSALPYANGPLHFGHIAGAYLPGDCYARYCRLQQKDTLYICGSDEYGVAITLSADLAKRSPQEHVDIFHKMNQELFARLNFSFDHYSRTTWKGHDQTVIEFFNDLNANGYIQKKTENHLYSEKENRFLADRYVIGTCPKCTYEDARGDECPSCGASYEATDLINPKSKLTNSPLILKPSTHWYLLFDQFKDQLHKWIAGKKWKQNVLHFVKSYIDDLRGRAITRDSTWGIPVPLEEAKGKVFYVWFDAPIGYISATKEWAELQKAPDRWKDYWFDQKTKLVHFIGKDNIPFHTVFFPAMIMGQNQPYKLPDEVPANEFLMLEGKQFSKSDGWYIDLQDFFQKYSTDQIRYALAANAPENSDADFSWKDFQMRCNTELLGKFGNLAHRTLVFAKNNCNSQVPPLGKKQKDFIDKFNHCIMEITYAYENFSLRKACQAIMELSHEANAFFDSQKPWNLAKNPDRRLELDSTIAHILDCLKLLALFFSPIIPETAQKLWNMLGYPTELSKQSWEDVISTPIPEGQKLPEPIPLFRKVEDAEIEKEIEKLGAPKDLIPQETSYTALKDPISFDQFQKLDLRIALVLRAVKLEKSKKLLKIDVDLGFDQRTIVAGIAQSVKPETLIGKKIIVVANMHPAKIMGIESQGMVLAASLGKSLELPSVQSLEPGSVVS